MMYREEDGDLPLRVVHLTLSFARGGRREVIRSLMKGLPALGIESYLCCLDKLGTPADELGIAASGVCVLNRRGLFDLKAVGKLHQFCRAHRVQVIHAHDGASQFTGALLRLAAPKLRLLMTFHRSLDFESARFRDRIRNGMASAMSQAIVTLSRERRSNYISHNYHVDPQKVLLIPNGVDTGRFHPDQETRSIIRSQLGIESDCTVFGAVGHFGPEKGIDVALRAWNILMDRKPNLRAAFVVLGDGSATQREHLQGIANSCKTGRVLFAGFHADTERWYRAFDVFVHAPRAENFSVAVIEAMATGLPVVGTGVGGMLDIVRPGLTGLLVPPDAPAALADGLENLLDHSKRQAMGNEGERIVQERYTSGTCISSHAALYRTLYARQQLRVPESMSLREGQDDQISDYNTPRGKR